MAAVSTVTDYDAPNERGVHRTPDVTNPTEPDAADSSAEPSEARVGAQYAYDMLSRPKRTELHTVAVHRRIRPHVHEPLEIPQQGYT